jgi:hypothetical protein
MSAVQLELFPDFHSVNENIAKYKESSDKVRRGVFAKVGELKKEIDTLKTRVESLENHLRDVTQMLDKLLGTTKVVEFKQEAM